MSDLNSTVSANRTHIGFFGLRNAGKSSVVNAITNQDMSLVSDIKGTTTDPVKKSMEILPIGPVVIVDTPGMDDEGTLGELRIKRTLEVLKTIDMAVLVVDASIGLQKVDQDLILMFKENKLPYFIVYNKSDLIKEKKELSVNEIYVSALKKENIKELKELNERLYSENFIYRDIKEKVIGKTCHYYPGIKESLEKLISGTDIEIIKENIEYDYYIEYGDWKDKALYDELFEVICEVVCVKHKTVRIAGEDYPYELVKSKFLKLNSSHLNYVIGCMKNTTTKITNIKAYMVTTLYNAPSTINHYYQQEVQHDMYGGGWHEKGIV